MRQHIEWLPLAGSMVVGVADVVVVVVAVPSCVSTSDHWRPPKTTTEMGGCYRLTLQPRASHHAKSH